MPPKAWLLYTIEYGWDRYEIGVILGEEEAAQKKAAVLFAQRVQKTYEDSGGDAAVVEEWKEKLIGLGMKESDLVGKFPPLSMYEDAKAGARGKTSEVQYHRMEVL